MTPQETFVTRLRRHRQRNRVSLDDIASQTHVKRELLEALENNDLSGWPGGLYARAWIRTYAGIVGLDPDSTVDEFCRLFPEGDRRSQPTIEEIASIVATTSQYRDGYDPADERRLSKPPLGASGRLRRSTVLDAARERGRYAGDLLADLVRALRVRVASLRQH